MRTNGLLVLAGVFLVGTSSASAQERLAQVAKNMSTRHIQPTCDLKAGHFLVSSQGTYLKSGTEASDPIKRVDLIEKGIDVGIRAITQSGQKDNGAAWYYLGRSYIQLGDIVGADSSFTEALRLAPQCEADIAAWRNRAWLPISNLAAEYSQQGNADSAIILFRQAAVISRVRPEGYYNMAVLYANLGNTDSSIHYFREAKRIAETNPEEFARDLSAAAFNLAAMLQRSDRHAEAVEELRIYVAANPNDTDAKRAMATSLRATGNAEEAEAIEREVLASAEAAGTLSTNDRMSIGINAFNEKRFEEAAAAFAGVLESEPHNRDARYNLANTYFALQDGEKLAEIAPSLIAIEPLNEDSHKLLAQGFRLTNQTDKLIEGVTVLLGMPTSMVVSGFSPSTDGATLTGQAIGRDAEVDGELIPPTGQNLVVEFLASNGDVVAEIDLEIPALEPTVTHDWSIEASAAGIFAWRYRIKE